MTMAMTVEMDAVDLNRYNVLPEVEAASDALDANVGFKSFLREFSDLAFRHGVNDDVAAFLLHAHFTLRDDERIVEEAILDEGGPAYAAGPKVVDETSASPMRWYLRDTAGMHSFRPIEYSTDHGVRDGLLRVRGNIAFISAYADLLKRYGLDGLVGLALTSRETLPSPPGTSYREVTDVEARVSILRVVEVDAPSPAPLIATTWQPDISAWCQPQTQCMSQWHCVPSSPGKHDRHPRHQSQQAGHQHHPD